MPSSQDCLGVDFLSHVVDSMGFPMFPLTVRFQANRYVEVGVHEDEFLRTDCWIYYKVEGASTKRFELPKATDLFQLRHKSLLEFLEANSQMAFVSAASTSKLKPDEMMAVNVNGKPVLLVNLDGTYYAIGNICTHMGCPLSSGTLKGETVECVCHGSTFDLKTGKVVRGPAEKPEPWYEVKVEKGKILISA